MHTIVPGQVHKQIISYLPDISDLILLLPEQDCAMGLLNRKQEQC